MRPFGFTRALGAGYDTDLMRFALIAAVLLAPALAVAGPKAKARPSVPRSKIAARVRREGPAAGRRQLVDVRDVAAPPPADDPDQAHLARAGRRRSSSP